MEKSKIIATNTKIEKGGLLQMKSSPEQEAEKSAHQQAVEMCNFMKNVFCVDGEVHFVTDKSNKISATEYFILKDSKLGTFKVAIII